MKKNSKLVLLGAALSVTAGVGLFGASVNADEVINAGKYTENVQQLQKIFTDKNKNFTLEKIKVENNKDNSQEPIYKLEGFDSKKNKEAEMKVNADKTSDVLKNKTERMDSEDKKEATALNADNVKKTPEDAINLAKKYANTQDNATEWSLSTEKVKGKEVPVYKVEFEKKTSSASDKTKTTKVKLNAETGDKISVKTENDD